MSPSNTTAAAPALTKSREELLAEGGEAKASIYRAVRQILNDLEQAAPWDSLYYPPANTEDFLRMTDLLILVIEGIPERVETLTRELEALKAPEELVGDFEFFFHGIHTSVEQELTKLKALFASFQRAAPDKDPTPDERDFSCELSADLKGKYSSSIMGASASLIAEGTDWRGVEFEPVLFPEKAQEFERNEKLVETLSEVTENIQNLLEQVPLAELVASWSQGQRVDQYALTALYSLLGNLGKLMREDSRRALYSGDYHQIQRREALLAARVNELTTLHNTTWGTMPPGMGLSPEDAYPRMVQAATELATVLSTDILKKIIGGKRVEDLFHVVMLEKEANSSVDRWRSGHEIKPHRSRGRIPEELHSLIILLYDEDLNTFLELLLGSVLKRASLTVRRDLEDTPTPQAMEEMLEALGESSPAPSPAAEPATPPATGTEPPLAPPAKPPEPDVNPTPAVAAPSVVASAAPASAAPAAQLGVALAGSAEETAFRTAAPPEVPDIGVVDMPEIDYGHAQAPEPAAATSAAATPATAAPPGSMIEPQAPAPVLDYPEVDFGAAGLEAPTPPVIETGGSEVTPNYGGSFAEPEEAEEFGVDSGVGSGDGTGGGFEAFAPPAEDLLSPPSLSADDFFGGNSPETIDWGTGGFDSDLAVPSLEASQPVAAPGPTKQEQLNILSDLEVLINRMTSSSSSHHKSFLMIHRLLKRGRAIPPAMVQSMQPYLFDLMNELLPRLHEGPLEEDFGGYANRLIQDCQLLCQLNFSGDELKTHVAPAMQNIVDLLDDLRRQIGQRLDELSAY
ncbi:MAG: hypothetical protein AAGM22_06345 [Acidobacteriota bacterium]